MLIFKGSFPMLKSLWFPAKNFHGMAYEISSDTPVLFYDGDCPLCNRVVEFILDQERAPVLHFSAQQHQATLDWLAQHPEYSMNEDTVYYFNGKKLYVRSTAVLRLIPTYLKMVLGIFIFGMVGS